jgi:hypothetical protein
LKLNCAVRMMLAALPALVASSQAARAETIALVCHDNTPNTTTLELDEAKGAVTAHWSDWPGHPGGVEVLQAKFTQNEITFGVFKLNRLTGDFINTSTGWHWTCQAGKKQF